LASFAETNDWGEYLYYYAAFNTGSLSRTQVPTNPRIVVARAVVGAAIVDVLAYAAVFELAADAFASDRLAAIRTLEQAAGER